MRRWYALGLWLAAACVIASAAEFEVQEWWRLRYADGAECAAGDAPPPVVRREGDTEIRHYRTGELELELRIQRGSDGSLRCEPTVLKTARPVEFLGAPYAVRFPVGEEESVFVGASLGMELRSAFFHAPRSGDAPWKSAGAVEVEMPRVETIDAGLGLYARHGELAARLRSLPGMRRIGRLTDFLAVEGLEDRHNHLAGTVRGMNPAAEIVSLRSWDDFVRGVAECDVIVNTLPGGLPAPGPGRAEEGAALIRAFLARGGRWIEFSGAKPFSQLFMPDLRLPEFRFAYPNRGEGTADFSAVGDPEKRVIAFYGVQQRNAPVFDASLPRDRYLCGSESTVVSLGNGEALWKHGFQSYAPPGNSFRFPATVIAPYPGLRQAVLAYGAANRIGRPLSEKVPAELLERWRRALLLKINDKRVPIAAWRKLVESKPFDSPIVYHHLEWVHDNGVFDQYYPDYFPYDPEMGGEAELKAFYRAAAANGDLAMPYTQPVFWDLAPERMERRTLSETVMRETHAGNDVRKFLDTLMTRDGAGKPYEIGGTLFHASPWHPAVREIDRRNHRMFVGELGAPLYFHDSIGAEPYRNDYSCHAPAPNAHLHGMLALAELERGYGGAPLATDEGFDLLSDSYAMLCGMNFLTMPSSWGIYHPYRERYAKGSCRIFPFLNYLLHDKVLLSGHNSGTSVFHRCGVSIYAVTGLSLQNSMRLPALLKDLTQIGGGWNRTLAALQNELGALTGGKALLSARYLADDVLETRWEEGGRVVGNLRAEPFGSIAPYGFLAEKNGAPVAGIVLDQNEVKWFAGARKLTPPPVNAAFEPLD